MTAMIAKSPPTDPRTSQIEGLPDFILENVSSEGLKAIVRAMLSANDGFAGAFEGYTRSYLDRTAPSSTPPLFTDDQILPAALLTQKRIRTMFGAGMYFEPLPIFTAIVEQARLNPEAHKVKEVLSFLTATDGDIIEAMTGVQRIQQVPMGLRDFEPAESATLGSLRSSLLVYASTVGARTGIFARALASVSKTMDPTMPSAIPGLLSPGNNSSCNNGIRSPSTIETWTLGNKQLPRMFSGLWQLASPAFGSAPVDKIAAQFAHHVTVGLTAYDMADHYGDAEIVYGQFRKSLADPDIVFASTKYCVFTPLNVTREVVTQNITQRCGRMEKDRLDLLQVHWQIWEDDQYIDLLRYCQEDSRVSNLGLCNFDTHHMQVAMDNGIHFVSNQAQFSLIDSRPTIKMAAFCMQYNIKLLTFGTLCGGFLSEKWLGKPDPGFYGESMTPSTRLYYRMIQSWGGWTLLQRLLATLKNIAVKRGVSVSNVATRWVLDFPYVGAVINGTRMGVSSHVEDNLAVFGWTLDEVDQDDIEAILKQSRRKEMFVEIGDCGFEYR